MLHLYSLLASCGVGARSWDGGGEIRWQPTQSKAYRAWGGNETEMTTGRKVWGQL